MADWYTIADPDTIDSPALIVYPERVKHNINLAIEMAAGAERLRPHVKTHKCVQATILQLQAGIDKFKCATIAEAEMLAICGAADVLLAYQPVGPKLKRFVQLIQQYPHTTFSCLIDNLKCAQDIAVEALQNHFRINVYVDLNVGMNRTGIVPGKAAELYLAAGQLNGIEVIGLHAYDGHVHDADLSVRNLKAADIYDKVKALQKEIAEKGAAEPKIVIGGSPTFPFYAQKTDVECSPGTFVYWDAGYQEAFTEQPFLPAALILARVISLPDETKVCIDLGHKSVAAENALDKRVRFLNATNLQVISQSEEHLVAEAGKDHHYKPGDLLYVLPYHICPTVALYERAITIENQQVTGEWINLARNRKINS